MKRESEELELEEETSNSEHFVFLKAISHGEVKVLLKKQKLSRLYITHPIMNWSEQKHSQEESLFKLMLHHSDYGMLRNTMLSWDKRRKKKK